VNCRYTEFQTLMLKSRKLIVHVSKSSPLTLPVERLRVALESSQMFARWSCSVFHLQSVTQRLDDGIYTVALSFHPWLDMSDAIVHAAVVKEQNIVFERDRRAGRQNIPVKQLFPASGVLLMQVRVFKLIQRSSSRVKDWLRRRSHLPPHG
jgi:hypothetical protein